MNFDHYNITAPDPIFLRIGSLTIHWYAILILIGVACAIIYAVVEGKKRGIESELFIDLVSVGLPLSILGTRVYYVLFNLEWFLQNPSRILAIHEGGLAVHGAIIVAGLYAWWALRKKDIPLWPILDIVAVGFFMGQITGRFGNFMNQEAHGHAINAPTLDAQREFLTSLFIPEFIVNGMFINGNYYHPTFLYEVIWNIVGLLIIIFVLRRLSKILVGEIAAFYAVWYSFGRIFIETLRTDSLMIGPLMTAQVISIGAIVVIAGIVIRRRKNETLLIPYSTFNLEQFQKEKQKKSAGKKKRGK